MTKAIISPIVSTKPTSKWIHRCHCPQEEKVFGKLRLSPLQPPSLQYFFTLLPFLPFLWFLFVQWIFGSNHCRSLSLFNKTRRCCFSVLLIQSLFPFTWSVAMPLLLSRFQRFCNFFLTSSLFPSIPSFPRQDCFSTFCCSFLCFVTVFSGRHKTPRWVVNKNNSQHRHQLKCK